MSNPVPQPIGSKMLLWSVSFGRISSKPVEVIELGDGEIKVVGSCRIKQKRDEFHESYHDTYKSAMTRLLADAQFDVNHAKKKLTNASRRFTSAKLKWNSYLAGSGDNKTP